MSSTGQDVQRATGGQGMMHEGMPSQSNMANPPHAPLSEVAQQLNTEVCNYSQHMQRLKQIMENSGIKPMDEQKEIGGANPQPSNLRGSIDDSMRFCAVNNNQFSHMLDILAQELGA